MSELPLHKADGVFFDWDGTLVDSYAFLHKAHNHIRAILGYESFSLDEFGQYFGKPRETLYAQLYGEHKEAAKTHFEEFVYANHATDLKPLELAQEILEWFHKAEIPMGVVTNKKGDLVRAEIRNFGWEHYFLSVVGAGEAQDDKPSHYPLELAVEQAGLQEQKNIWLIGDTESDIACANGYEACNVLIADAPVHQTLCEQYVITHHFHNHSSFYDFLLQSGDRQL